jgi:hypothetical protein
MQNCLKLKLPTKALTIKVLPSQPKRKEDALFLEDSDDIVLVFVESLEEFH